VFYPPPGFTVPLRGGDFLYLPKPGVEERTLRAWEGKEGKVSVCDLARKNEL